MNFAEAVKVAMKANKMTTADLARATNYSYQYVRQLLSGERRWHEQNINRVCEALDVKIEITHESNEESNDGSDEGRC